MAKALELLIYGEIGSEVAAADVVKQLSASKAKLVNVRINSGGGSAFDGMAIYTALKAWPGEVHTHVDGLAASAASVIAMAGDVVNISSAGTLMIHSASAGLQGNASDLSKQIDVLNKLDGQMASIYASRTGADRESVLELMAAETWFNAEEAVEAGLADNVVGAIEVAACANLEAYGYRNAPAELLSVAPQITAPVQAHGENEMKILAKAAGLQDSATDAEIVAKVHSMVGDLRAAVERADQSHEALSKLTAAVGAEGDEALGRVEAGKVALSVVDAQGEKLAAIEAKAEVDAHAALIVQGKAAGKLTADLEKWASDKSSVELGAFLAVAPKAVPVSEEVKPEASAGSAPGLLLHGGKSYDDMSNADRLALHAEQPELFQSMSDQYRANLNAAN